MRLLKNAQNQIFNPLANSLHSKMTNYTQSFFSILHLKKEDISHINIALERRWGYTQIKPGS